ncbi:MAG TPA: hypothetical protein VK809_08860 [Bacteroidia bacterium]|jgi:hypothetical protein|nr:hypothetical protein [Bacteroidia bacterium]
MKNIKQEEPKSIPIKPYKLKDLSKLYNVHRDTLLNWLKPFQAEIGERIGYYYTIPQVEIIFKNLDLPSIYKKQDKPESKAIIKEPEKIEKERTPKFNPLLFTLCLIF